MRHHSGRLGVFARHPAGCGASIYGRGGNDAEEEGWRRGGGCNNAQCAVGRRRRRHCAASRVIPFFVEQATKHRSRARNGGCTSTAPFSRGTRRRKRRDPARRHHSGTMAARRRAARLPTLALPSERRDAPSGRSEFSAAAVVRHRVSFALPLVASESASVRRPSPLHHPIDDRGCAAVDSLCLWPQGHGIRLAHAAGVPWRAWA